MAPRSALVVVPTYNEAENIALLLAGIRARAPEVDVLFVDDNSQDGTRELIEAHRAEDPGIHLLERPRRMGLGTAYVAGFRWALSRSYGAMIEMDADLSHDPADLPGFLELLESYDVVVGSRYIPGGGTRNWGLLRQFISRFGSFYARVILGLKVRDLTGGFNAWRREVLETLDLDDVRSEGYAFQIELKYRAHLAGFSVHETPIVFVDRRAGRSKMGWPIVVEAVGRVWALRAKRRAIAAGTRAAG